MHKVCAGIVTFNPEVELLIKNIDSIINQVNCLIIVDNGSKNYEEFWKKIQGRNILMIRNNENLGIAKALNQLCEKATELECQWILTLDQDSISPSNLIVKLAEFINDDVAIIAPNIVYKNNESFSDKNIHGIKEVEWVITSASFTNLNIWKQIGGFDEKLFIDGVDRDYGIRANKAGYKVIKNYDVVLMHELGSLQCRKKFGRTIYVTNHSAVRKYYMSRNAVYLDKKHHTRMARRYILKLLAKTLFFEEKKLSKFKAILSGVNDAKCMKY